MATTDLLIALVFVAGFAVGLLLASRRRTSGEQARPDGRSQSVSGLERLQELVAHADGGPDAPRQADHYVFSVRSRIFHVPTCPAARVIAENNRRQATGPPDGHKPHACVTRLVESPVHQ